MESWLSKTYFNYSTKPAHTRIDNQRILYYNYASSKNKKGASAMIGLSLSLCVADICEGKVKMERVEKIISGLTCRDEAEWDNVIEHYKKTYWSKFPEEAEKIVRQLREENKIELPRLKNGNRLPFISHKRWVRKIKEIEWRA